MFASDCQILIVDDLVDNLFLLQAVLQVEGYQIKLANSGFAALATIQISPPDLILLDLMMPDMNGIEVTQQIRCDPKLSHIPILLVTAYAEANAAEGLKAGANSFIRKPIDFDELLTKIKAFLPSRDNVCSG